MGADIHIYPEFASSTTSAHWSPLGGRFNGSRDYDLFGKLAGVRCEGQMYPLRGLPPNIAWEARSDNTLFVSESVGDRYVTRETAQRWVDEGASEFTDGEERFITCPDWHSHSWLTPAELREALEACADRACPPAASYWGLLAMLEEIERRGCAARIVFWFDN